MSLHATRGRATKAALHQAQVADHARVHLESNGIERYRLRVVVLVQKLPINWVNRKSCRIESRRFPVPRITVLLAISTKQTYSHAQVQSKVVSYLPIVLEIRLGDLVTLVVTVLRGILSETLNVSSRISCHVDSFQQEVGKGISRAVRQIVVGQEALFVARSRADGIVVLVALVVNILRSELKSVFADRFAHVVT